MRPFRAKRKRGQRQADRFGRTCRADGKVGGGYGEYLARGETVGPTVCSFFLFLSLLRSQQNASHVDVQRWGNETVWISTQMGNAVGYGLSDAMSRTPCRWGPGMLCRKPSWVVTGFCRPNEPSHRADI